MEHDPKSLQSVLRTAAPPDMELRFRPMFGGILAYADGNPLASVSDMGLALKFSGADHVEFAATGAKPLRYAPDQPLSKSYLVVPDAMLADRDALRPWIVRAAAGAKPAAVRKSRRSL